MSSDMHYPVQAYWGSTILRWCVLSEHALPWRLQGVVVCPS